MAMDVLSVSKIKQVTDEELAQIASTQEEVFLELMNRYETKLLVFIRRISNSSLEDAEDILQDVYIKVFRNLNDFDPSMKFSSWIYRITRNQVITDYRKKQARPQNVVLNIEDDLIANIAAETDIAKEVDQSILKDKMADVLEKLDKKYKEVIVLKYLEQKDYKEISDIIKKPMGTVATLLNRAKKQLQKQLRLYNL